ncbi:hypothetical protein ColLi_13762 [Colletotrichum liriopes]|uniref:Uncharacterized protein n=1 Tax=Colletotrichum liriopes TaxID=708192 RepID=A0AA37M015_9PEZI|nr:hypothetical protein ColLi_13762 [Colletotrichum liriopes]
MSIIETVTGYLSKDASIGPLRQLLIDSGAVVSIYLTCRLMVSSDKLINVSGLARSFTLPGPLMDMDTSENAGEWLRDKIRQISVEAPAQRTAFDAMGDVSEEAT